MDLPSLDGFAGLAALINSAVLYPTVKALKRIADAHDRKLGDHHQRLGKLEKQRRPRKTRK